MQSSEDTKFNRPKICEVPYLRARYCLTSCFRGFESGRKVLEKLWRWWSLIFFKRPKCQYVNSFVKWFIEREKLSDQYLILDLVLLGRQTQREGG